jgi:signal transduction histidine kinase
VTLRARFTLLAGVLLAAVLATATAILVELDGADAARRLERRARDVARPRPLPEPGAPATFRLPVEPDGARAEVFVLEVVDAGRDAGRPRLRAHGATGDAVLAEVPEALLPRVRALAAPGPEHEPAGATDVRAGGVDWTAAVETWPPPPGPPGPGRGDGGRADRPAGPPPLAAVGLVESGPEHARHRAFLLRALAVDAGALLLGGACAYLLARRMLRPVAVAAAAAERLSSAAERLPAGETRDELGRLIGVLNEMLARLEEASERERRFQAGASHELRRPLAALLGELELAAAAGRSETALRAAVGLALEDARAMSVLLDDLIHHARAQSGRLALEVQDTDLVEIVASAVERSRRATGGKATVEVGEVPAVVLRVDPDAMRRVVENLVVNATVHGGSDVRIRVAAEVAADRVRIHVDDDGPGVPPEEAARIFEPFARGDRAKAVRGMGLGLAIAQAIVRAHGGRLTLTSPRPVSDGGLPRGSRFTVDLPASIRSPDVGG